MPHRADEIRIAHLLDVIEALRQYIEQEAPVTLETEYISEDQADITFSLDLRTYYPLLQHLTELRFPASPGK